MKEINNQTIQLVLNNGQIIGKKKITETTFSQLYLLNNSIYSIAYINQEPFFGEEIDFFELSIHTDYFAFSTKALKKFGFVPKVNPIYCDKNGQILKVNELKNLFNYLNTESNSNDELIKQLKNIIG